MNVATEEIVTTEEILNFNMDNEDIEIVKAFAYLGSVINSNGDCRQDIKRRLSLRMAEIGKLSMSKMCHKRPRLRSSTPSSSQLLCMDVKAGQ